MFVFRNRVVHASLALLTLATTTFAPHAAWAQGLAPHTSSPLVDVVAVQPFADLAVMQIDSPDPVAVGNFVTYRVSVTNNGPSTSGSVRLSDVIPSTSAFVAASAGCVFTPSPPVVTCQLGNLVSGTTTWRSVTVRPWQVGPISNYARATSAVTFDPFLANNVSILPTTVNP